MLLPERCPFWDFFRYYWVGWTDKGGGLKTGVFLRWKDKTEVPVLEYTKGSLYQLRVLCQELMGLLDCSIFRIAQVLGERGGW